MGDDAAPRSEEPAPRRRRRRRRRRKPGPGSAPSLPTGDPTNEAAISRTETGKGAAKGKRKGSAAKGAHAGSGAKRSKAKGRPHSPVQREVSAGGVVYRRDGDQIEVVLASRRTRRGELAWGLAKGGIEPGESLEQAALREVREETGYAGEIEASLGETRYFYVWEDTRIRKTVHFFLMRCTDGDPGDRDDEMEEVRWFPLERALKRAAYRGEREVLGRAAALLR
jgi:8-oxo-dGTP pyrophosphatase MutT (NUDIX family)